MDATLEAMMTTARDRTARDTADHSSRIRSAEMIERIAR